MSRSAPGLEPSLSSALRRHTEAWALNMQGLRLERLPKGDKDLCGLEPGNRAQVSTNIDSHRPYRRLIADAETNGIAVVVEQTLEVNSVVHIAAIIEDHASQTLLERYWEPSLRINDEELLASDRDSNLRRTSRGVILLRAKSGDSLWSRAI